MKHRAEGKANVGQYPNDFRPAHCAGTDCLHDHPGETSKWRWLQGWRTA